MQDKKIRNLAEEIIEAIREEPSDLDAIEVTEEILLEYMKVYSRSFELK
jgi:hypothetical protein